MYILIIARGYPTEKYKLNGIFEFDQAKALAEAGHKVIYASIDMRSIRRARQWGFENLVKEGVFIESINVPCGRIPKSVFKKIQILALKNLYKRIEGKHGKPDIIHAHFLVSGYITALLFENSKTPLILTEHSSEMNQKVLGPYFLKIGRYTYSHMDKVITVSKHLADNIKEKFGVETTIIPNIVDTKSFEYINVQKDISVFNFISTGSLTHYKGMDILIESFNKVFSGNKKVNLYIYGEGPERSNLEKMILKYALKEQVFLMGLADRKEIAKRMSESDSFVLASRLETFGVAYIEAMAMGLPVIATRCGGPEDFVTENNGVLVSVGDIDALSNAMRSIYKNINHYDRKTISESTKNRFGAQIIVNKLTEVYEKCLNENKEIIKS